MLASTRLSHTLEPIKSLAHRRTLQRRSWLHPPQDLHIRLLMEPQASLNNGRPTFVGTLSSLSCCSGSYSALSLNHLLMREALNSRLSRNSQAQHLTLLCPSHSSQEPSLDLCLGCFAHKCTRLTLFVSEPLSHFEYFFVPASEPLLASAST